MKEEYLTRLQVLWVTEKGGYMFHTNPSNILYNFKGHTRLLGNPDEQNCTVEMDNVQTHDNGPFCFRAERELCEQQLDIEHRTRVAVKCSVNHTCSTHPPEITWSVPTARETISHNHMGGGVWETVSAVTFIPTGYEEKDEIVCTANFWGGKTQENTAFLRVRRVQWLRLETLGSTVIAPSLVFILICVLAGVFIYKIRQRGLLKRNMKASLFLLFQGVLLYDTFGWESHHGEKLYTWIDPENVGKGTYKFYDVTSTIQVDASPQLPSISIYGGERTGDAITVVCSSFHTCPYSKPTITLNGIEGSDEIKDESIKDGLWKTTLTRTGVVKTERSTIQCSVTYYGGITVTATKEKSAECVHQKIMIEPELADVTEGIAKNFVCSVYHSCQKEPTITWNYENMQVTKGSKTLSDLNRVTYSDITFLGAKDDHGKKLICTANFSRRKMTTTVVLHVQCVHQKITIEPELADVTEGIAKNFTCSVYHSCQKEPTITWNYENMQVTKGSKTLSDLNRVTYSDITFLGAKEDHGKKLICTSNFSGGNITAGVVLRVQCVHHNITIEPELADVTEGDAVNFTCTIYHSCQKEPSITWNYENMQVTEWNKTLSGLYQISYSSITFLGAKEDHGKKLICTAKSSGRDITASVVVNVQYPVFIGLKTIGLFIVTPSLVFLLACILAGVVIYKKQQRSKDVTSGNKPFSKPRMPSPKSDPKSSSDYDYDYEAEYVNVGELNLYGNI
ncbi:hypothetical protein G5714_015353 [Onychostoma macrolepis]|uniref:Ig-like domain-containing protein n=1 Tax=Onychostoma macrolepis TaxID=369639 RepID=A0A7J6CAY9_9TELE|nr:hypothetical protein G5714_015353 [Onychostoma macrolepis]